MSPREKRGTPTEDETGKTGRRKRKHNKTEKKKKMRRIDVSDKRPYCTECKKHVSKLARHLRSGIHQKTCYGVAAHKYDNRKGKRDRYRICPVRGCKKREPTTRLDYHLEHGHGIIRKADPEAFMNLIASATKLKDLLI